MFLIGCGRSPISGISYLEAPQDQVDALDRQLLTSSICHSSHYPDRSLVTRLED